MIVNGKGPDELPPADELAAAVGSLLGVEGGDLGTSARGRSPTPWTIPRE